jgi:Ca2+-binding RTX toxin-like protein
MTTAFKYTFYAINAIPPTWLTDKVNIKHDVTTAMTSVGAFPAPIDSAMKFAVPNAAAILSAMSTWSRYIDVSFSDTTGTKNIAYGGWNPAGSYGSATTFTENGVTGNYAILLNKVTKAGVDMQQAALGNWGGWVHMHELYHVLKGLKDNGISSNDLRNSILTYPNLLNGVIDPTIKIPLTPGMQDILDLQNGNPTKGIAALGLSTTSNGNDSYDFSQTLGPTIVGSVKLGNLGNIINIAPTNAVMTIWDSGGIDSINATNVATSTYINLNAGHFSAIGTGTNAINEAGVDHNVGIAFGATIENAMGGTAADTLVGNASANILAGGKGSDTITGGAGGDYFKFDAFNPNVQVQSGLSFTYKAADTDVITDFNKAQGDKIDLSFIDANTKIAGDQAFSFIGSQDFTSVFGVFLTPGQLHIEKGGLFGAFLTDVVSGDVNGDGISDFRIQLVGFNMSTLTASDFIL